MTKIGNATVYIITRITNDGSVVTLKKSRREITSENRRLTPRALGDHRERFYAKLNRFKDRLGNVACDDEWNKIDRAVKELHACGRTFLYELFGNDDKKQRNLQKLIRTARPEWKKGKGKLPVVVVQSRGGDIVPIEFLPLLDIRKPQGRIADLKDLCQVLRAFLGFSACVRRVMPLGLDQETRLNGDPKLPVKFFQYGSLRGVKEEITFLQSHGRVAIDGPWPNKRLSKEKIVKQIVRCLRDPSLKFTDIPCKLRDQVRHFGCHSGRDYILLSHSRRYGKRHERRITIDDLKAGIVGEAPGNRPRKHEAEPLVFLNGCGTMKIDPTRVDSWPDFFLENGGRGFIGTEAPISDRVAAQFSTAFYENLLEGKPLGTAIHSAKWKLVNQHKNPLGILYTVYANPRIRIDG